MIFKNPQGNKEYVSYTCIQSKALPSFSLLQELAGNADQHAVRKRRFQARLGELIEHLRDGEAVVLSQVIEQTQSVVLNIHKHRKSQHCLNKKKLKREND